jgi:hypothetical protein
MYITAETPWVLLGAMDALQTKCTQSSAAEQVSAGSQRFGLWGSKVRSVWNSNSAVVKSARRIDRPRWNASAASEGVALALFVQSLGRIAR